MNSLVDEWRQIDPFLLDLEGFQRFCDVRAAGSRYPLHDDDIFLSVEPIRTEWRGCAREQGTGVGTCEPQETPEDYWKRNNIASATVRAVVALFTQKADDDWPEYLASRHLEWVEAEFGVALTEDDFARAWALWEHPYWFSSNNGYYVQGWLAVADALGIGAKARDILEKTSFPHADAPRSRDTICRKRDVCPIYQYREYLKTVHIDVPDLVWRYSTFQNTVDYHVRIHPLNGRATKDHAVAIINHPDTHWQIKWKVLRMIKDYATLPPCKACGELSHFSWKIGTDAYDAERQKLHGLELCWNCLRKVHKAYETRVMPLTFQDKHGDSYGKLPELSEMELRKKLIEGDDLFAGITVEDE